MKNSAPTQLTLFPMPQKEIRGLSYANAIRSGLHPYEYKSVVKASCMKAILDFKIWGKTPCLGCCFRDIATGEKFVLYAHDDCHSRRYTPKDKVFDFSQSGIEGSLFYLVTRKTRKGKISWQNARLLPGTEHQSQFGTECLKDIPALSELSFCRSAFAMYSCPKAPPEAFPPISHKPEKPKERRRGQGREAPAGPGLDCAAAFGSVPWSDGTAGKARKRPSRAGEILFHPKKIGVDFRGKFIAILMYSIVFIYKNVKNLILMKDRNG